MRALAPAVLALALCLSGGVLAAGAAEFAQLEGAVRAHPDDAALVRALARAQLDAGEFDAALATLRAHGERAPNHRTALAQLLGRALYAKGELALARTALQEALAQREPDALAHFYLGLVELRLGDREAAARELARAEALEPALAERVRAAMRPERSALKRALSRVALSGGAALEYDSNVTLEGDEEVANVPGDRADGRLAYNAAIAARLLRSERLDLALVYRFDERRHQDVDALDVQSHAAWLSGTAALTPKAFARLEGGAALHRLDQSAYLRTASLGTGFGWRSESRGILELRALAERRAYEAEPPLPSLERDGWRAGATLRHSLPLQLGVPLVLTTQLAYARTLSDGERDLLGFGPAFESHYGGVDAALQAALPHEFLIHARLALGLERFDARNVIDFLSDNGTGDLDPERRRDHVIDASLGISRAVSRWLELELRVRETRHLSNVDLYDWDRQVVGSYVRLRWQVR